MKNPSFPLFGRTVFWTIVLFYIILYAPFGMNESDGGFMSGYAWQWICGKKMYTEIFYVRSPLPVWIRAFEIWLLPNDWQVLGERIIFFLKIAGYSWLAADFLGRIPASSLIPRPSSLTPRPSSLIWPTAIFSFIVSVHCYPPASLHTFDGILFSVFGLWLFSKNWMFAAGVVVFLAAICKQSFYPIPLVLCGLLIFEKNWRGLGWAILGFGISLSIFIFGMENVGIFSEFLRRTSTASSSRMLFEQGFLNLFRVNPVVAAGSLVFIFWGFDIFKNLKLKPRLRNFKSFVNVKTAALVGLICWLSATYIFQIWNRQEFTPPVAQSRILFWLALGWAAHQFFADSFYRKNIPQTPAKPLHPSSLIPHPSLRFLGLLAITWCCTVSWGYSFPIQFAVPGVWVLVVLWKKSGGDSKSPPDSRLGFAVLILLLATFRYGYEFVYRDGKRSEMTYHIGDIFPKAQGIFSDKTKFEKYSELKSLWEKYPSEKVVLPWFCQAHFLMETRPVLPLDWIANREMNSDTALIFNILNEKRPTIFLEKMWLPLILSDPEHTVSKHVFEKWTLVEDKKFYSVYQIK